MNYKEYGNRNSPVVILLHGGGLSWWNYREIAEMLKDEYHIILPILDGHAGSDRGFTTIEENAREIISFIKSTMNGSVFLIGGLSLGGQILLDVLSQENDICRFAFIESAMVIPSQITNALIRPAFGLSYPLIKKKWFAKLQFRQLRIKKSLFDDYYRDTCQITKTNMIAFLKANSSYQVKGTLRNCSANIHIYYGQREIAGIRKSAKIIKEMLPKSALIELPNLYHGDFSINHPEAYAEAIRKCGSEI